MFYEANRQIKMIIPFLCKIYVKKAKVLQKIQYSFLEKLWNGFREIMNYVLN